MSSRDKRSRDKHRGCCASVSGKCADWYGPNGPVTPRLVSPAARAWVIVRETRPVWRGASRSSDTPTTIGVFCVTMSQDGSGRRTPPRGEQLLQDSPAPPTPPADPPGGERDAGDPGQEEKWHRLVTPRTSSPAASSTG